MLASHHIFHDSKENVKSVLPTKTSSLTSRKGLKACSLNSFADSAYILESNKSASENNSTCSKLSWEQKENSKSKMKAQESEPIPGYNAEEDSWSDIEKMHICVEPDDDYSDIMPQCERIQKEDIDALFRPYSFTKYTELTVEKMPSPPTSPFFKDFRDLYTLDCSPPIDFKASLFDESELGFIPMPDNLFEY